MVFGQATNNGNYRLLCSFCTFMQWQNWPGKTVYPQTAYKHDRYMKTKKQVVVVIASLFVIGADWAGETTQRLFHSYFADIAIPFGYYLLLVLIEDKYMAFQKWYVKAASIFLLCSISETLQYFGIYALARVFDPVDYGMYALGVVLAALVDRILFKKWFPFWQQ